MRHKTSSTDLTTLRPASLRRCTPEGRVAIERLVRQSEKVGYSTHRSTADLVTVEGAAAAAHGSPHLALPMGLLVFVDVRARACAPSVYISLLKVSP